jgi:division protein CdvB (Snf7/Vps24/ESCRT-III family)
MFFNEIYANVNEIQRIIDQFLNNVIQLHLDLLYEDLNF